MKTTRQPEKEGLESKYQFSYSNFPQDGEKQARIEEWENGEGCDVYLGGDKIELTHQEITVLEILFAHTRLLD
jgi:hypothetical protein